MPPKRGPVFEVSITSLLPLLRDQAHSVATIRYVMNKIKDTVAYLNIFKTPVIAVDQPIYALAINKGNNKITELR